MSRRARHLPFVAVLLPALFLAGCSPAVICSVETVVLPDYTCRRTVRLSIAPHRDYPNQRPRLGDYFQFPPAEMYETYLAQPEKAVFAGIFRAYDAVPPDLSRLTPLTDKVAGNAFSFGTIDLVLLVLADFDETIRDIIASREDGQAALAELVRLAVPEAMAVLNARYGGAFELARLEQWLQNDLVAALQRVYAGAWNIRMAKRSGVTSPGEMYEVYMLLKDEARREGLELAELDAPGLEQENIRRLKAFAVRKARELCPPRQAGGAPLSPDMFSGNVGDELLGAVQKAVTARHGSINEFIRKIGTLLPRAFGAYLIGDAMPIYMIPEVNYYCRLRVPGTILQTNGTRDVNGDILWSFTDSDLALTGQSMWVKTLFVREPVLYALGVKGFPGSLMEVDRLFSLAVDAGGRPREALLTSLQQSVRVKSLSPLEALAGDASSPDAASARGVLELLSPYRDRGQAAGGPGNAPPAPTPPAGSRPPPAPAARRPEGADDPLAPIQPLDAVPTQPPAAGRSREAQR